jgi:hypothetical protein
MRALFDLVFVMIVASGIWIGERRLEGLLGRNPAAAPEDKSRDEENAKCRECASRSLARKTPVTREVAQLIAAAGSTGLMA